MTILALCSEMLGLVAKVIQEHPVGRRYETIDYLKAEIQKPGNEKILDYCIHAVCVDAVNDYTAMEDYHKEREAKRAKVQEDYLKEHPEAATPFEERAKQATKPEADFFSATPFKDHSK